MTVPIVNPIPIEDYFQQAQTSLAAHKKLVLKLHKIHLSHGKDRQNEQNFNQRFIACLNKILSAKKRSVEVKRIDSFISHYIKHIQEKEQTDSDDDKESYIDRFVETILRHLLQGFEAKDRYVRTRVCQLLSLVMDSLTELDEDLLDEIRTTLLGRIKDKDPLVRANVAIALSLQCIEDDTLNKDIMSILTYLLRNDPSGEVRRAVLLNIELNNKTLPHIIERTMDVDPKVRKVVYRKTLKDVGDFRSIPLEKRELILKNGLMDRDQAVRKSCVELVCESWIKSSNNLIEFLARLDVISGEVAEDALMAYFISHEEAEVTTNEDFWENLSPESAFLIRVYSQFLTKNKKNYDLEGILPDTSSFTLYLEKSYNNLYTLDEEDEMYDKAVFVVSQLLETALLLDYGDELGKRNLFALLKGILVYKDPPETHIGRIVDIIKKISLNESDFSRIIIEIKTDIESRGDDEDMITENNETPTLFDGNRTEDAVYRNIQCLTLIKAYLERCELSLKENSSLHGMINELITPAVRSNVALEVELGLTSLGLCCILDKSTSQKNMGLFVYFIENGNDELKKIALEVIFDIILVHSMDCFSEDSEEANWSEKFLAMVQKILHEKDSKLLGVVVKGVSKALLFHLIDDQQLLKELIILFFHPDTSALTEIRQLLSFFLPTFCLSSFLNQSLMAKCFVDVLQEMMDVHKSVGAKARMITPIQIATMMIDWTDCNNLTIKKGPDSSVCNLHGEIAVQLLSKSKTASSHVAKLFIQTLNKLRIDSSITKKTIKQLMLLISSAKKDIEDVVTLNALGKFGGILLDLDSDATPLNEEELSEVLNEVAPDSTNGNDVQGMEDVQENKVLADIVDDMLSSDDD